MIKSIFYIIIFIFTIWAMEGLNLNRFFKQSKVYQARIMYLMIAMSITYLTVNFLYDFVISIEIV